MHFFGRLISITISYSLFIALIERAYTILIRRWTLKVQHNPKGVYTSTRPVDDVQILHTFDYKAVEPIKYRPFETKHHVTMGMLLLFPAFLSFLDADLLTRGQKVH